ncbi:unnamed protein product [Polarella glacialis]|uniref:Uncharacterized protein n=1 Tax=Polarella glacialis TaxID=89957 RepID=A0A813JBN0_POLGL|nr:unnamed protein product [Polarella glacialis]
MVLKSATLVALLGVLWKFEVVLVDVRPFFWLCAKLIPEHIPTDETGKPMQLRVANKDIRTYLSTKVGMGELVNHPDYKHAPLKGVYMFYGNGPDVLIDFSRLTNWDTKTNSLDFDMTLVSAQMGLPAIKFANWGPYTNGGVTARLITWWKYHTRFFCPGEFKDGDTCTLTASFFGSTLKTLEEADKSGFQWKMICVDGGRKLVRNTWLTPPWVVQDEKYQKENPPLHTYSLLRVVDMDGKIDEEHFNLLMERMDGQELLSHGQLWARPPASGGTLAFASFLSGAFFSVVDMSVKPFLAYRAIPLVSGSSRNAISSYLWCYVGNLPAGLTGTTLAQIARAKGESQREGDGTESSAVGSIAAVAASSALPIGLLSPERASNSEGSQSEVVEVEGMHAGCEGARSQEEMSVAEDGGVPENGQAETGLPEVPMLRVEPTDETAETAQQLEDEDREQEAVTEDGQTEEKQFPDEQTERDQGDARQTECQILAEHRDREKKEEEEQEEQQRLADQKDGKEQLSEKQSFAERREEDQRCEEGKDEAESEAEQREVDKMAEKRQREEEEQREAEKRDEEKREEAEEEQEEVVVQEQREAAHSEVQQREEEVVVVEEEVVVVEGEVLVVVEEEEQQDKDHAKTEQREAELGEEEQGEETKEEEKMEDEQNEKEVDEQQMEEEHQEEQRKAEQREVELNEEQQREQEKNQQNMEQKETEQLEEQQREEKREEEKREEEKREEEEEQQQRTEVEENQEQEKEEEEQEKEEEREEEKDEEEAPRKEEQRETEQMLDESAEVEQAAQKQHLPVLCERSDGNQAEQEQIAQHVEHNRNASTEQSWQSEDVVAAPEQTRDSSFDTSVEQASPLLPRVLRISASSAPRQSEVTPAPSGQVAPSATSTSEESSQEDSFDGSMGQLGEETLDLTSLQARICGQRLSAAARPFSLELGVISEDELSNTSGLAAPSQTAGKPLGVAPSSSEASGGGEERSAEERRCFRGGHRASSVSSDSEVTGPLARIAETVGSPSSVSGLGECTMHEQSLSLQLFQLQQLRQLQMPGSTEQELEDEQQSLDHEGAVQPRDEDSEPQRQESFEWRTGQVIHQQPSDAAESSPEPLEQQQEEKHEQQDLQELEAPPALVEKCTNLGLEPEERPGLARAEDLQQRPGRLPDVPEEEPGQASASEAEDPEKEELLRELAGQLKSAAAAAGQSRSHGQAEMSWMSLADASRAGIPLAKASAGVGRRHVPGKGKTHAACHSKQSETASRKPKGWELWASIPSKSSVLGAAKRYAGVSIAGVPPFPLLVLLLLLLLLMMTLL